MWMKWGEGHMEWTWVSTVPKARWPLVWKNQASHSDQFVLYAFGGVQPILVR